MNSLGTRKSLTLALAALLVLLLAPAAARAAKGLKKGDAQKLVAALPPFALNKGAVSVKEISSTETAATVLAGVRAGFHFVRDGRGVWRVAEVRVGDRQWEDFDLLARVLGIERMGPARAALDALAAELDARARDAKRGVKVEKPDEPLVRGALRVEKPALAFSPLGSSAVLEAEVEAAFEFVREAGKWRVASARVGGESFREFAAFARALDAAKVERAREDLGALASALEAYRRERGFYVVAETESALNDHLSPRFIRRVVRVDPWHRPYVYEGARDRFVLRSAGPDGKPNTADDVTVGKG